MNPKVITFYLPQFHRVPENDEWWGEGFTDWVSAKNARPLFPGHYQPRIPAHDNYYNLLDKSAMEWQAKLAKKSGVDGFCIYHYWFGEKQLLEKPAENLLKWKDIDINYCFSWANESWIASWSKLTEQGQFAWTDSIAPQKGSGMLMEQKYGDKSEWKRHFQYLLPFFQDERYIKKDGKPVFVIYNTYKILCAKDMIAYWNELAKENGFPGIFFIGTNNPIYKFEDYDAALLYEPDFSVNGETLDSSLGDIIRIFIQQKLKTGIKIPQIIHYDKVWKHILQRRDRKNVYKGAFVDFDSSPRKGKKGIVLIGANPEKFYQYFSKLYDRCSKHGDDFIFVTAWNEWGEGAYLEPDKKYGMGYLNAIRKVVEGRKQYE